LLESKIGLKHVVLRAILTGLNRIRNPLVGIPKAELLADVETFATENGLEQHLPMLRKGALVAQNPGGYDTIEELDNDDRFALHHEATKRWSHPNILYFTIILNSIAAAIQGWDQTGSNGANISFPAALGIDSTSEGCKNGTISSSTCQSWEWIQGFINACPYIVIAVLYDCPSFMSYLR
jgi:hypothetical protein